MDKIKPRWFNSNLQAALRVLPVTVLTGARQTGKTTLTRAIEPARTYFTLDDVGILDQAERNPDSLLSTRPVILDEVQRAPQILLAVKRAVDTGRRAGDFLLTGSANLLLMKQVAETLAGRAIYLDLPPFCPTEWQERKGALSPLDRLFAADFDWREWPDEPGDWARWLLRGGFPPALEIASEADRGLWFAAYVQTYLAQIPLQIGLHIGGKPQAAVCFRSNFKCRRKASPQEPSCPVARFIRPFTPIEIRSEQTIQRRQCALALLPLGWAKRRQIEVDGAASQRLRHLLHQQEIGRAGQDEISGPPAGVNGTLDGKQDLRRSLDFIENDWTGGKQRIGIALCLVENPDIVESEVGPRGLKRLGQGGFSGLPCACQDGNGQDSQGGLEITVKPARLNSVHIV